jgi:aconitate hydratase
MTRSLDSFHSRSTLKVGGAEYEVFRLDALDRRPGATPVAHLPYTLRILLENLLRHEDGSTVSRADIEALASWDAAAEPAREIAFRPARVLMQDFTGVPAIVDLAAMRDAMARMGGDSARINPLVPAELVIDHSVQVDAFGSAAALQINIDLEYRRNRERYAFLRWGQKSFRNFTVVPPGAGIVHQVNLEHLARVVFADHDPKPARAYPDTVVGTDSHTTMINGLGVLGWGVGGIEAEAAMLGQPVAMLVPQVVGFRLTGRLRAGTTATDLVLTVTEILRRHGVVGKFVEFVGEGIRSLSLADRATIANMAPEYGATCGFFPVDRETLAYLRLSGRSAAAVDLVEAYASEQGLFATATSPEPRYSEVLDLDLAAVVPSVAGPRRPQDRVALADAGGSFRAALPSLLGPRAGTTAGTATATLAGERHELRHGTVVIAAITSCTNTSNPSVMVAAGLLARKAVERGLATRPWVKTSLAPGSRVVTEYLTASGLAPYLEKLGFHTVGYGCTTCIGNSGPLLPEVSAAIEHGNLVAASVLSGNRNFEGRINSEVRANYLMSPPLVVAFALAGRIDLDLEHDPLGEDAAGRPVYLREIWPSPEEVNAVIESSVGAAMFTRTYGAILTGDEHWRSLPVPEGRTYAWAEASTYIRHPPYFVDMPREPAPVEDIRGARVLALLGDSVTTDHISPAGSIKPDGPAGRYLVAHGVEAGDFNSYGARRGNHEVMVRGTFANVRLKNLLAPGTEGGVTRHLPGGETMSIFDAALRYRAEGVPLVILAGAEYGSGSSRDWAGKGPALLGVRAVIARSYERIHRSNLIGMGVVPLQFQAGEDALALGLGGEERFTIEGLNAALAAPFAANRDLVVRAEGETGAKSFRVRLRLDTPQEAAYYRHGGILPYVLRQLLLTGAEPRGYK